MQSQLLRPARSIVALSAALVVAAACSDSTNPTGVPNSFQVTRLVADLATAGAVTTDANLQNAWGLARSAGSAQTCVLTASFSSPASSTI